MHDRGGMDRAEQLHRGGDTLKHNVHLDIIKTPFHIMFDAVEVIDGVPWHARALITMEEWNYIKDSPERKRAIGMEMGRQLKQVRESQTKERIIDT